MYKSLEIKRFRCFKEFAIHDLYPINLIAGRNNVGKTTLLEALFLHCGGANPELALRLSGYRGVNTAYSIPPSGQAPWHALFHNLDLSAPFEIQGADTDGSSRSLRMEPFADAALPGEHSIGTGVPETGEPGATTTDVRKWGLKLTYDDGAGAKEYMMFFTKDGPLVQTALPKPHFPTVFVFARGRGGSSEDVQRFSRLIVERRTEPVVETVRLIEPRVKDLSINVHMGSPQIWADIDLPQLLPVQFLGDGVSRVLVLATSIASCKDGVILIDEVEAGLHHSTFLQVWRAIMDLAQKLNVQVFATTHSHECLVAARDAAQEFTTKMLRVHRLDRIGERITATSYDDETLEGAIDAELEIR